MNAKTALLLLLSATLLAGATTTLPHSAAASALPTPSPLPQKFPPGNTYRSPHDIFSVVAPEPTGFDVHGWEVAYESTKGNHEMVTFYDIDFGETYRAGVAEIYRSDADLEVAARASAVTRKHQIGLPIDLVEETKVQTQFGEGSLRVHSIKGGSLLGSGIFGQKHQTPQFHDSYIAVLLVPHDGRIIITLSQDDNLGIVEKVGDDAWKKALKDQVQTLLATMTLGKSSMGSSPTPPLPPATGAPPEDPSVLYFFNVSGWKVFPEKLTLLDNDQKEASLYREYYATVSIAPGHHVLQLKEERPTPRSPRHELDFDAMPGVDYYVIGGFTPNGYSFLWTLDKISKDDADKLLARMKPQPKK